MTTIDMTKESWTLTDLLRVARTGPVLLVGEPGEEFLLAPADDFEHEVEVLRNSRSFQEFLDRRSQSSSGISAADLLAEIESKIESSEAAETSIR